MELALAMLDGPVISALLRAPGLKLQRAKPLFRSIALTQAVSSLPHVQPYDADHQVCRPLVASCPLFLNSF